MFGFIFYSNTFYDFWLIYRLTALVWDALERSFILSVPKESKRLVMLNAMFVFGSGFVLGRKFVVAVGKNEGFLKLKRCGLVIRLD